MSLTKEKIIAQTLNKYMLNIDDISRGTNAIPAAIHSAMEEYALQEMGSFGEWLDSSPYIWWKDKGIWSDVNTQDTFTTQQVIELYYESIKG